ncbi:autotransporter outer membrane beta-barrel domain-containing protein [Bartonella harrusi]
MSKKNLLLCTAAATVLLFGTHYNLHAESLEVSTGTSEVSNKTYETIHAKAGGKIIGKNLTIIGNKNSQGSNSLNDFVVTAEGANSSIELDNTTIKGTNPGILLGLEAKDGASIKMIGGSIATSSGIAASFKNSKNDGNKLENVTISGSSKIYVNKSTLTLNRVTVGSASDTLLIDALRLDNASIVTVSGGSFYGTVYSNSGSIITLKDNVKIKSHNFGLISESRGLISHPTKVTMTGGEVTGEHIALHTLSGHIDVTDVVLKTGGEGTGANSAGSNGIINLQNTTIEEAKIGLDAHVDGAISMTGGSITVSEIGASFTESKNDQNKLEGVKITSNSKDKPLSVGINADQESSVTLKDVTVTKAEKAISANNNSQVTVSGGVFEAEQEAVYAKQGSTIALNDNVTVTSENNGLHADGEKSQINMTEGEVTGKKAALLAENSGYIDVTDITLTAYNEGTGVSAIGPNSMINLHEKATIKEAKIGLEAKDNGVIQMTGGSITVSQIGASFENSKNDQNKLENVVIASSSDDKPIITGVSADKKSTVALKNITVQNAEKALFAHDHSQITLMGGGFFGGEILAKQDSTIALNDNVTVTSENNGLHADGEKSQITMTGGEVTGKKAALLAENSGYIDVTNVVLKTGDEGTGASAIGPNSMINLHEKATIKEARIGLEAKDNGVIQMTGGSITVSQIGASFENSKNDQNKLENVVIASSSDDKPIITGVSADKKSTVALKNITVQNAEKALFAHDHSQITLTGGGSLGGEILAKQDSTIALNNNVTVTSENNGLHADGEKSQITMTGGTIKAKEAAFVTKDGGHIDVSDISAKAQHNGIRFDGSKNDQTSEINLTNTDLLVEDGTGIVANNSSNAKLNLKDSKINADQLFVGKTHDTLKSDQIFTLTAQNSLLQGGARNDENGRTTFDLKNNTTWFVKTSTQEKDDEGNLFDIAQRARSDVSVLHLNDSKIIFQKPTENHYHTLHIGSGKPETQAVYNATGDAEIYFNAEWSDGAAIADQKTDRLLIHGDVSGTTTIYVTGNLKGGITASDFNPSNTSGVSLIQVSGNTDENSFKLTSGDIQTMGSPYKYRLAAYGPTSSYGVANETQNLLGENDHFWDFRLQRFLLPQVSSYLAMPNALFYAGFIDMAKQSTLLADLRTTGLAREEEKKNKGFFLSSYGSIATLSSQYDYETNIRYAATQAGFTASTQYGKNATLYWGLIGTYGQLSLTPKDIEDADKSTLNKWSITAYGSIERNCGFYIDTLFSYGIWKGNIATALAKNTTKVDDIKMLIASTTIGQKLTTHIKDLTFEPQAQLVYQRLIFNTFTDADNLKVDIGEPHQWLLRIGGRLTKTIVDTQKERALSFYGKLNLLQTFGDDHTIQISDTFPLDPVGPAIEGGLGINVKLSRSLALHGDINYRKKLQKTGISGTNFSGGIRYQF